MTESRPAAGRLSVALGIGDAPAKRKDHSIKRIVIVGGGTAGWLSACYLAARLGRDCLEPPHITLIEAPDIPTIGVGEGSWPTLRSTLAEIGIGEAEFLLGCDASFKQGSRFDGWRDDLAVDRYLHPFTPPPEARATDLIDAWRRAGAGASFAATMTPQAAVCDAALSPRQRSMPDYAGALNYGYHLDAGKLAAMLSRHAVQALGVVHVADLVTTIRGDDCGGIASVMTRGHGEIEGDLFIDCSGQAGLLIGQHLGVDWVDCSGISFNDRALAVQVPVSAGTPIASQTIATAHDAGWLWDIGLPTRRGVGCVYASRFASDDAAEATLRAYLARTTPDVPPGEISPRRLTFRTGYREKFWHSNCVAIGLSAGFIEPLEASAIVLIELSLRALADNFPASRDIIPIHAERFNAQFGERWQRIIEFLKLHYALSKRSGVYWQAQRDPTSFPPRLSALLRLWLDQPPSAADFPLADEMFPAASYQYVYYGMGGSTALRRRDAGLDVASAGRERARGLLSILPTNRSYLDSLRADRERLKVQKAPRS